MVRPETSRSAQNSEYFTPMVLQAKVSSTSETGTLSGVPQWMAVWIRPIRSRKRGFGGGP
jgi:hypothetical protein